MRKLVIFLVPAATAIAAGAAIQEGNTGGASRQSSASPYLQTGRSAEDGLGRNIDIRVPLEGEFKLQIPVAKVPDPVAKQPAGPAGRTESTAKAVQPIEDIKLPVSALAGPEPKPVTLQPAGFAKESQRAQPQNRTAAPEEEETSEGLSSPGMVRFDNAGGGSFWAGLKERFFGPKPAALDHPVKTIEHSAGRYLINGKPAARLGFGSYKQVLIHPENPGFVVSVFNVRLTAERSLEAKDRQARNIRARQSRGDVPRLQQDGVATLDGRKVGFLVQERVEGRTLEVPNPARLEHLRRLFARYIKDGVEIADTNPLMLRRNLMVGRTASGGWGPYLVNGDLIKSGKSKKELQAFYEGLYALLASRKQP